jgi:hypothetical protein
LTKGNAGKLLQNGPLSISHASQFMFQYNVSVHHCIAFPVEQASINMRIRRYRPNGTEILGARRDGEGALGTGALYGDMPRDIRVYSSQTSRKIQLDASDSLKIT